ALARHALDVREQRAHAEHAALHLRLGAPGRRLDGERVPARVRGEVSDRRRRDELVRALRCLHRLTELDGVVAEDEHALLARRALEREVDGVVTELSFRFRDLRRGIVEIEAKLSPELEVGRRRKIDGLPVFAVLGVEQEKVLDAAAARRDLRAEPRTPEIAELLAGTARLRG